MPRPYAPCGGKGIHGMENISEFEGQTFDLVDEEGNECSFELLGDIELDGVTYVALVPVENEDGE